MGNLDLKLLNEKIRKTEITFYGSFTLAAKKFDTVRAFIGQLAASKSACS
ncbi:MAG: hypothetical protein RBT69_01980 [Spirochaetia bacterium]|nr:hypothetical protein [Spirochaetia bacterium]